MRLDFCCACDSKKGLEHHHLIPRSDGGSDDEHNLITLCYTCHGKIHGMIRRDIGKLVKDGIERAKERGVKFGAVGAANLKNACPVKMKAIRLKGTRAAQDKAQEFAESIYPFIAELREQGKTVAQIAEVFNQRGYLTYRGTGRWHKAQLFRYIHMVEGTKKGSPEGLPS